MELATKSLKRGIGGAALAAILATEASAQSTSWPTPPTPPAQVESPATQAVGPAPPPARPASQLSAARIAQILAPVALYPDDLLADVLVAATYPLDVAEAAQWLEDPQNAALKGDQLFAAMQQKPWDPSVKSLAPFPQILRVLDANLEWTEQLGEAYLADPAAVMDVVQGLRRRAQSAGRLVTTPQGSGGAEQAPARIEEPIAIEASSSEIVYVPICDPSFAYGPWPYPGSPPFVPVFAGATVGGCDWISGPIIAPFWGLVVLNFRTRHIDVDRRRLALFDRDHDRERRPGRALPEEWRHDPGHRGNVPYRNPAVSALFGKGRPPTNVRPGFGGRWTGPPPVVAPRAVGLPQEWRSPRIGDAGGSPLDDGRRRSSEIRVPPEGARSSIAGARPALEGVDPTEGRTPDRGALERDAARRMLIERESFGRVPPGAMVQPLGGLRPSPSFGGMGSTRSLGDRRVFRPPVGVGVRPPGGRGPSAIGAQPLNGRGPQAPPGGMGAGGGRGGG